jgi:hypothetical protein
MKTSPRTTVLRVLGSPQRRLEEQFALKSRAAVRVSMYEFEGHVVRYDRPVPEGVYEVTVKVRNKPSGPPLI